MLVYEKFNMHNYIHICVQVNECTYTIHYIHALHIHTHIPYTPTYIHTIHTPDNLGCA